MGAQGSEVTVVRDLVFARTPSRALRLDLYLPPASGPLPLIVWAHGGAFRMGGKDVAPDLTEHFASRGYAMASIEYRLSGEALFPAQIEDVKSALRWLRAHAGEHELDPGRVGLWGESAGGYLAALAAVTGVTGDFEQSGGESGPSSSVQAVVDWYGPIDFLSMDRQSPAGSLIVHDAADSPESELLGEPIQEIPDRARAASPLSYVTGAAPPFLIMHGTADLLVPVEQSRLLHRALREHDVDARLVELAGVGHGLDGFTRPADGTDTFGLVGAFFDRHLRG